jgi:Holliday junction resolvase
MSGSRSRNKGARAERDVVAYLRANGFPYAERRLSGGVDDRGDVAGVPGLVIEVKDRTAHSFPEYVRQLEAEVSCVGVGAGLVIAKRAGTTDVGSWYAVTRVDWALEWLR